MQRISQATSTGPVALLLAVSLIWIIPSFGWTNESSITNTATGTEMAESPMQESQWIDASGAKWIWPESIGDKPNQYAHLLHDFEVPVDSTSVTLAISVDTNYAAYVNGMLVDFGQWSDYPDDKTFDVLNLTPHVHTGKNRMAIIVYYQGHDTSQYRKGIPGAIFAVKADKQIIAASGEDTHMRQAPEYVSGNMPLVTGQLGFTFEHRGDRSDSWLADDYQLGEDWTVPGPDEMASLETRPVRPRPVKKLVMGDRIPMKIFTQGTFVRKDPAVHPAAAVQGDALAFRHLHDIFTEGRVQLDDNASTGMTVKRDALGDATGVFLVLDTGREEAGLLDLELDAPAGTIVDVGYGEHLEDMRVRAHVGGRNFGVRHVHGSGHGKLLHPFLRLAGRYLQVHITAPEGSTSEPIILKYAGLRPTDYPVDRAGTFASSDSLHDRIWEVSRRTLELCMHEHYEDCPWREQALYGMDARNQSLAGYYTFGGYDFARASIKLLGQGYNPNDGFLELCAPARVSITIPSFSLAWILWLDDYMMFSGDIEFAKSQLPIVHKLLETCNRESTGPIIGTPQGPRMWNFYEWAPGLDGTWAKPGFEVVSTERNEAPLNLFYLLALDATARMAREAGEDATDATTRAEALREAFHAEFWDAEAAAYLTRTGEGQPPHHAELTQALAIIADVVPEDLVGSLRERLASDNNGLVPCTISHTLYKFEALLTDREKYATRVFELIARDWGYMLSKDATSFWETIDGAEAFGDAGSLCHGWSGIPAWFYGAYVLGVKPTAPGFKTYDVNPVAGGFFRATGKVPTPNGILDVEWDLKDNDINLKSSLGE